MKSNFLLASFCAAFVTGAPSRLEPNSCGKTCLEDLGASCDPIVLSAAKSCISSSKCSGPEKTELIESIQYSCEQDKAHITAAPSPTPTEHLDLKRAWGPFSGGGPWSGSGPWGSSWTGTGPWPTTGPYSNWAPASGNGPFGGNWGPWGSTGAWTNSPWTSWWGEKGCPDGSWSGWTEGPWSTNAPWTSWTKGCTATTTATSTFTTTSGGSTITGTSFGIKVAEATGGTTPLVTGTGSSAVAASTTKSAASSSFLESKRWLVLVSLGGAILAGLM